MNSYTWMIWKNNLWKIKENLKISNSNDINESALYYADGTQIVTTGTAQNIYFKNKVYDLSGKGNYNTSSGVYTVPKTGVYLLNHRLFTDISAGGMYSVIAGDTYSFISSGLGDFNGSSTFFLYKGQEIKVIGYTDTGTHTIPSSSFLLIKKIK